MNRQLSDFFVTTTANTIWSQIKVTATPDTIGSWGISELYAQEITARGQHYAALVMRVQGFMFSGYVIIAYCEGEDLYNIYTADAEDAELVERQTSVYCDILVNHLDRIIEKGDMTEAQYQERILETYFVQA